MLDSYSYTAYVLCNFLVILWCLWSFYTTNGNSGLLLYMHLYLQLMERIHTLHNFASFVVVLRFYSKLKSLLRDFPLHPSEPLNMPEKRERLIISKR